MKKVPPTRLNDLKSSAKQLYKKFLLRDLHAIQRFAKWYPEYTQSTEFIDSIKLKHAFSVIACEYEFDDWSSLKHYVVAQDMLYRKSGVPFVHAWFKKPQDATDYFNTHGGYLLKFWGDYIVCGEEYIGILNLNTFEKEWRAIGFNWVHPKNEVAFMKLQAAAETNYLNLKY
ncbi:hypothetical protein O4H26_09445 [Aequorivita viscosa]|nr:hypothetical protein [Aequorivita viscosa]